MMPMAASAGATSGVTIHVSTRNDPAPSSRAASSISLGSFRRNPSSSQIATGTFTRAYTRVRPHRVLLAPITRSRVNSGTTATIGGSSQGLISVPARVVPPVRNRTIAQAPGRAIARVRVAPPIAATREFPMPCSRSEPVSTSTQFENCGTAGTSTP